VPRSGRSRRHTWLMFVAMGYQRASVDGMTGTVSLHDLPLSPDNVSGHLLRGKNPSSSGLSSPLTDWDILQRCLERFC
jgi:hypothetical protein